MLHRPLTNLYIYRDSFTTLQPLQREKPQRERELKHINMEFKGRFIHVFATIMLLMIMSSQLMSHVDCRALRSRPEAGVFLSLASKHLPEEVSSSSSTRRSVRGLAFTLASGPSRKGPGH